MATAITPDGVLFSDSTTQITAASVSAQQGMIAFGRTDPALVTAQNIISSTGVIASDTTNAGTARTGTGATSYGGDKLVFVYGISSISAGANVPGNTVANYVSNTGVLATDTNIAGNGKQNPYAFRYGTGTAMIYAGQGHSYWTYVFYWDTRNLITDAGVIATDSAISGDGNPGYGGCASYGGDKAAIAGGWSSTGGYNNGLRYYDIAVSNTGVFSSLSNGYPLNAGTGLNYSFALTYGFTKALFINQSTSGLYWSANRLSSTGTWATAFVTTMGLRSGPVAAQFGGDSGLFSFGQANNSPYAQINTSMKVSNTGVFQSEVSTSASGRNYASGGGFGG